MSSSLIYGPNAIKGSLGFSETSLYYFQISGNNTKKIRFKSSGVLNGILFLCGANSSKRGLYFMSSTTSGNPGFTAITAASDFAYSSEDRVVTLSNTGSTYLFGVLLAFNNDAKPTSVT